MKTLPILRIASFLGILWFTYWVCVWEIIQQGKTVQTALAVNPINTLMLIICVSLFIVVSWRKPLVFFFSWLPDVDIAPKKPTKKTRKSKKAKPKNLEKPTAKGETEIPASWRKPTEGNPGSSPRFSLPHFETRKIRVPGLRFAKRFIAAILLIVNLFIAQGTLMSAPASQPLYLLFVLNSGILLDYLWKTRRKQTI